MPQTRSKPVCCGTPLTPCLRTTSRTLTSKSRKCAGGGGPLFCALAGDVVEMNEEAVAKEMLLWQPRSEFRCKVLDLPFVPMPCILSALTCLTCLCTKLCSMHTIAKGGTSNFPLRRFGKISQAVASEQGSGKGQSTGHMSPVHVSSRLPRQNFALMHWRAPNAAF